MARHCRNHRRIGNADRAEHIELIRARLKSPTAGCRSLPGPVRIRPRRRLICRCAVGTAGIDAYLIVVPYYNKPVQEGMYQHFSVIADAVDKPVMMYNVPGRTVADMLPETVARLAEHENIFGIKEATGDIERLQAIQDRCRAMISSL